MRHEEKIRLELLAMQPLFKAKVRRALTEINRCLALCDRPYVSFSGGKDSAVLLHLVREVSPLIPAKILLWEGESEYLGDYGKILSEWGNIDQVTLTRELLADSSPDRWESLAKGHDAAFIGLRADESKGRRMSLRSHGTQYQRADGMWRFCPLAWWAVDDVAAYIISRDLPILAIYESAGFETRSSTRIPRADVRAQAMRDLAAHNPKGFVALRSKFPELCSNL